MKRSNEAGEQTRRIDQFGRGIAVLTMLCLMMVSGTASAVVTIDYVLTPDSSLVTEISTAEDFFTGTLGRPTWLDGSLATPPVDYLGDTPDITKNIMRVEFPDDGSGNIIDGTITVTLFDFYHPTDAGIAGTADITGINDSNLAGATGTMVGGVVTGWSTGLLGQVHNELKCENIGAGALCGQFGLPANGTTVITHDNASVINFDTAGSPVGASQPMTFGVDYSTVTAQATIETTPGRQYFSITGVELVYSQVPAANMGTRVLIVGLLAMAGILALGRRRAASFTDAA